ncbi:MAG TPA: alpha/beta hydrolase, partial [Pseudonocardiaceae bacterium]
SGPTTETGWSPRRIAAAYLEFMSVLGYERFFTHGGDYGAATGLQLAVQAPGRVLGTHITIVPTAGHRPEDGEPTEQERRFTEESAAYRAVEHGYIELQRTKPQTLSYALNDSPSGLAAWIVEKFWRWTDHQGNLEDAVARDQLLSNITLYWLTRTAGSSARIYHASATPGESVPTSYVGVPVGCAIFPAEIYPASRRWAEHHYNVVRWTEMDRGGHFAAFEVPELVANDFIAFARQVLPQ